MTENRLINIQKIKKWQFIPLVICLCISIYFLILEQINPEVSYTIYYYSFGLYFFTLFFNYGPLRNFNLWLIWIGLSTLQILIYYKHELNNLDLPAVQGLRNFWLYLIFFQILRWLSLKLQNKDFVVLSRLQEDFYDNRPFGFWDYVLFIPAIAMIFILQIA